MLKSNVARPDDAGSWNAIDMDPCRRATLRPRYTWAKHAKPSWGELPDSPLQVGPGGQNLATSAEACGDVRDCTSCDPGLPGVSFGVGQVSRTQVLSGNICNELALDVCAGALGIYRQLGQAQSTSALAHW